jgi:hypothetical protein
MSSNIVTEPIVNSSFQWSQKCRDDEKSGANKKENRTNCEKVGEFLNIKQNIMMPTIAPTTKNRLLLGSKINLGRRSTADCDKPKSDRSGGDDASGIRWRVILKPACELSARFAATISGGRPILKLYTPATAFVKAARQLDRSPPVAAVAVLG